MNRSVARLALVLVLGAIVLSGCTNPFDQVRFSQLPAEAQQFVTLMNDHRKSEGLEPLEWHSQLADVALDHSQDMHDRSFFDHTNLDDQDPFDRIKAAGISYEGAGENIARGYATGQAVFDGWIGSAGHRANIENAGYTHHGLGYVEDGNYWTHVFAKNPAVE